VIWIGHSKAGVIATQGTAGEENPDLGQVFGLGAGMGRSMLRPYMTVIVPLRHGFRALEAVIDGVVG